MSERRGPSNSSDPGSNLGSNLPGFRAVQLEFAAHIRNPSQYPKPADVDERRMRVYRQLVYNNIEGFVAGAFPIAKKILNPEADKPIAEETDGSPWHKLVREFVHQHASTSPYFLEVSQEFLEFLGQTERPDLPPFLLELCHYEWVELALRVDEQDIPSTVLHAGETHLIDPVADLLEHCPVVSPLTKSLAYNFAVHQVQGDRPISAVEPAATFLVVYRDRDDRVRFLEINAMTALLLELLDGARTGAQALRELAAKMSSPQLDAAASEKVVAKVLDQGVQTLNRLRDRSIILGALPARA